MQSNINEFNILITVDISVPHLDKYRLSRSTCIVHLTINKPFPFFQMYFSF